MCISLLCCALVIIAVRLTLIICLSSLLGELSVVRIIFTTAFIAVFWACLSAPHEAKGSLKYLASVVLAHLIFGIILNLLVKFELLSAGQVSFLYHSIESCIVHLRYVPA